MAAERAVFATASVGRVFVQCFGCRRVRPYYDVVVTGGQVKCPHCGDNKIKPARIPEWKAAWWVLIRGWFWRKTVRRVPNWDPRMPVYDRTSS